MKAVTYLSPRKWGVHKRRSKQKGILEEAIKRKIGVNVVVMPILVSTGAETGKSGSLGTWDSEGGHWRGMGKVERDCGLNGEVVKKKNRRM